MKEGLISFISQLTTLIRVTHQDLIDEVRQRMEHLGKTGLFSREEEKARAQERFLRFQLGCPMVNNDALQGRAEGILCKLLTAARQLGYDLSQLDFQLAIARRPPFRGKCFIGGQIILAENWVRFAPAPMLAALISHEVAHAVLWHGQAKWMLRTAVRASLNCYDDNKRQGMEWYFRNFLILPLLRRHEYQADLVGCDLMMQAGYSYTGMLWLRYEGWLTGPAFVVGQTHPDNLLRMLRIIKRFSA